MGGAEPCLKTRIGADQSPGPVGNGDGGIGPVYCRDGDGPIGQGKLCLTRLRLLPGKCIGDRAQCQHTAAKGCDYQRLLGDEPQQGKAGQQSASNRQPMRQAVSGLAGRIAHLAARSALALASRWRRLRPTHQRQPRLLAR